MPRPTRFPSARPAPPEPGRAPLQLQVPLRAQEGAPAAPWEQAELSPRHCRLSRAGTRPCESPHSLVPLRQDNLFTPPWLCQHHQKW